MTDDERETARTKAIELLNEMTAKINQTEGTIPELCRQAIFEGQDMSQIISAVQESILLRQAHAVSLVHFDRLVIPESVQNNRQLFFEALDTIKQQNVVTVNDIDRLENLVISAEQITQDALIDFKLRAAH